MIVNDNFSEHAIQNLLYVLIKDPDSQFLLHIHPDPEKHPWFSFLSKLL